MPDPVVDPNVTPTPDPAVIPGQAASWLDTLPPELKGSPSIVKFKEPASLAKSYIELEKNFGNALRPPPPDADQKTMDAFYQKLGRPVTPEEYPISRPDDVEMDDETEKRIRLHSYRLGHNARQTQEMVNLYATEVREAVKERNASTEKADHELKEKWGGNYERNTAIIGQTLSHIDPDGALSQALAQSGLGNHPGMIDLFLNYGRLLVEDGLIVGDVGGIATRESAKAKILEIRNDPKHPYHTSKMGSPAFEEFKRLNQIAYD